jgi:hypothetical protein
MSRAHFDRLARELEEDDDAKHLAREERLAELRDIASRKRKKSIATKADPSAVSFEDEDTP